MSFLFKSKNQKAGANALPPASRDIRSSDGTNNSSSQIPTLNGAVKPASPTPGQSVNNSLNSLSETPRPGTGNGGARLAQTPEEKVVYAEGGRSSGMDSPEQKTMKQEQAVRNGSSDIPRQRLPNQALTSRPSPDGSSPYPWSMRPLTFTVSHTNPFPRYGAAVNSVASKDASVYLMGGLINGSTVKGDLWMVDANPGGMTCFPVATTSEGPGPRVGHASLLVGNAFIVFGGDTKMEEGDQLDDTLYLLNTSTKQWSRALPAGARPPGRYGHTLNILGSKIYIFGGQVEGYFFNDLVAFDLNALQQATNRWEILIQNTIDGGPPHGQIPPARTNHTTITWGDKLFLFGGTDGVHWFNDVWSYSPHTNSWTQLECIGYIPAAREGHAAALVGDVMYIFGGRNEDGNDLGDLAAFRITSRRWYTFQNMGPSPSPRSGHSMTTVGKQIVVIGGEPSSAPRDPVELAHAYFLDTGKIRYPPDTGPGSQQQSASTAGRRPSGERSDSRTGLPIGVPTRNQSSPGTATELRNRSESVRSGDGSQTRLPLAAAPRQTLPAPTGPPPQPPLQQSIVQQPRLNGGAPPPQSRQPSRPERGLSPVQDEQRVQGLDRSGMTSPQPQQGGRGTPTQGPASSGFAPPIETPYFDSMTQQEPRLYNKPETYQPSQEQSRGELTRTPSKGQEQPLDENARQSTDTEDVETTPKVRELQEEEQAPLPPQDSGIGSSPALTQQHDELLKELEQVKQRNAWYASELALARKSGYQTRSAESPVMDERAVEVFGDEDKPLVEALLKMKAELARVQETIDEQSKSTAERIAEMEKQRDAAVSEAVYAKTRLAGTDSGGVGGSAEGKRSPDQERHNEMGRKLASSLNAQTELSRRIDGLIQERESEKRARQLADDTAEAAQRRVGELEGGRQQYSSEMESLRSELHEAQRQARDVSASHAEVRSAHDILVVDKRELDGRLEGALEQTQNQTSVLTSLREAVSASTEKAQTLEQMLGTEREQRTELERKLRSLKSEHEERTGELDETSRRLKEAEDMAEKHAEEARTHRGALLAGLGKVTERDLDATQATDERVTILQQQAEAANAMVRQNQMAADLASEKLRRAEERIAGLEAFQEQASREGLTIRKQLQAAMKENQGLSTQRQDLEQKVQSQMLETNALSVQHASLRDILGERGINASEVRRSRALDSPNSLSRFSTPDLHRVKELEQQLDASLKSHDEMKTQFEEVSERDEKMKREYEDKLAALDNDHQAAVKYLRGTEKMLSKMKQELQRVKDENRDVKKKLDKAERSAPTEDLETERDLLKKEVADVQAELKSSVEDLEARLDEMQQHLQGAEEDLHQTKMAHASSQADMSTLQATHSQTRGDVEKLQKDNIMLEERARDAENKVQLLLDQVESSVDNYRRQSRVGEGIPTMNGTYARPLSNLSEATANHAPSHSRGLSDGGNSTISESVAGNNDGRNSMALDSLASELETLRTHWETTNKSYRLSDKFDFERTPTAGNTGGEGAQFGTLANWRRGLDISDEEEKSRPGTSDGANTVVGGNEGSGMAVTTPTQADAR